MKYISFIITIGGDTGWRFMNSPQWNSAAGQLLFDADKFTNESIHDTLSKLMNSIKKRSAYCSTFSEKCDNGMEYILPFIEETDGVYVNNKFIYESVPGGWNENGWKFTDKKSKLVSPTKDDETTNYQELRINKPEPTTYTIDDICRLMARYRFLVRPPYQREEVINRKKSSEIIESLLLGIKLPPIFIFKSKDGISEVIDGQQRILSILAFLGRGYLDEEGKIVKSNKDGFSLMLKDSILTDLNGKHFSQLDEDLQDKITNFDLWVIEINEKNNPDFEPLDLFIRLNNKPYPIKDDTFEMWNSYLDRRLINTIKASYKNNASWFFMRKASTRMENENNYTVLSYFNYLEQNKQDATEKGPLDIYKIGGRIAIRLRSKGEISKILEDAEKKDTFAGAVNHFEFTFISNLRFLLTDDKDDSDKTLSKNLDEMLGVENKKRTQQSFYALWHFLKGLAPNRLRDNRIKIRQQVKELFNAMQSDIKMEEFNTKVEDFRLQYEKKEETGFVRALLGDVVEFVSFDGDKTEDEKDIDFYIKRDNRAKDHIQIELEQPKDVEKFYGCRINRIGFTIGYIVAVLQSSYVFKEYDFQIRNASINSLKNIEIPLIVMPMQNIFDKVIMYTQTKDYIQSRFFENVLNMMTEEVYLYSFFVHQNVKLLDKANMLEFIHATNQKEMEYQSEISAIYLPLQVNPTAHYFSLFIFIHNKSGYLTVSTITASTSKSQDFIYLLPNRML